MKNLDLSFYDEKNDFFFLYKKFRSSFYIYKWKENKFFFESVNFYQKHRFGFILKNSDMILMKNIDLAFVKEKKNLDLYFNKKYGSSFFLREKIQICILMKNTDLVFIRNKKKMKFS